MQRRFGTLIRNMLLLENPQFLPNIYETLPKWPAHEWVILAKSHNYWVKIADFLIKAYLLSECQISCPRLYKRQQIWKLTRKFPRYRNNTLKSGMASNWNTLFPKWFFSNGLYHYVWHFLSTNVEEHLFSFW